MASTRRKLVVISQDSVVKENIRKWATKCDHEVTFHSAIPENPSVAAFDAVDFIILDGNLAYVDGYNLIELVSKIPVVVISDINDTNSDKKNAEALKKGAIDTWYLPIDEETCNKMDSLILAKKARRKLFVVSQDSTVVESIRHWAGISNHEVTINSTIPKNASVVDFNAVDFIILDGNLAHDDDYKFIELVSKIPVVVISDINDNNSHKMNIAALKKGAIDYWYPPIDEDTCNKIDGLILGKEKSMSTSKKRKPKVEEGESSDLQGNEEKKKKVNDSPTPGLYPLEGGGSIRYIETPRPPKNP